MQKSLDRVDDANSSHHGSGGIADARFNFIACLGPKIT